MSDDFFAGWTDLGDDTDDPFNATSAAVPQQSVQPPPATQAEPAPAPAPQQITAAPRLTVAPVGTVESTDGNAHRASPPAGGNPRNCPFGTVHGEYATSRRIGAGDAQHDTAACTN